MSVPQDLNEASNVTETNILKGPFVNISRIVGISRGTSWHSLYINAY